MISEKQTGNRNLRTNIDQWDEKLQQPELKLK
jgi:hypothetical protein